MKKGDTQVGAEYFFSGRFDNFQTMRTRRRGMNLVPNARRQFGRVGNDMYSRNIIRGGARAKEERGKKGGAWPWQNC